MSDKKEINVDTLPLEARMRVEIESRRSEFYMRRKQWLQYRTGGPGNKSVAIAYGQEEADRSAAAFERGFTEYLEMVLLDEDGNSTNPDYPVVMMVNARLRYIRMMVIGQVSEFFQTVFMPTMDPDITEWKEGAMLFNMTPFIHVYNNAILPELVAGPTFGRDRPLSTSELHDFMSGLCRDFAGNYARVSKHAQNDVLGFIIEQISSYILAILPYRMPEKENLVEDLERLKNGPSITKAPVLH